MKPAPAAACLLMLSLALPCAAQTSAAAGGRPASALQQQGLAELDNVIHDADSLKLPENRIRVEARAADLLWPYDRARALGLFSAVVGQFSELLASRPTDADDPGAGQELQRLRHEVASIMAARAPRLALDFIRATKPGDTANSDQEAQLEMELASQVAREDARLAAQIAGRSAKSYNYQLPSVWLELLQRDPAAAAELSDKMLQTLRGDNLANNQQALQFAINWLNTVPRPSPGGEQGKVAAAAQPVGAELARLINAAVLNPASSQSSLGDLRSTVSLLEQYSPASKAQLEARASQMKQAMDPNGRAWLDFSEANRNNDLSAALAVAAQAPEAIQAGMYQSLAMQAANNGDLDGATRMADEISDRGQREQALSAIKRQSVMRAAEQGKFDNARALARALERPEEAAMALSQLALTELNQGKRDLAAVALDDARRVLPAQPDNQAQMEAFFQVAFASARVDPGGAAEILGGVADRINTLIPSIQAVDAFLYRGSMSFRDGELLLEYPGMWGNFFRQLTEGVGALGARDPQLANSVAEKIALPEVRINMHLRIAQALLQEGGNAGNLVRVNFRRQF